MVSLAPIFKKAYWSLAGLGTTYAVFLLCLLHPTVQKHAIYVHKVHSGYYNDVTKPEVFGFARNQVTPLNISTSDGETLFAWHILPIGLYAKHEEELLAETTWLSDDVTERKGFQLLVDDPESKLIILFHGNAGHVGEGWRPDSLRSLSSGSSTKIHVLTIDYRGFGSSTGDPSEAGLIADGVAAVNWAIDVARIPPSRIVLLGQSLGTAVTSAVALHFASGPSTPESLLPPNKNDNNKDKAITISRPLAPTDFAGIVLVAPFTTLPHLVLTYRIKGILPILSPLRPYPYLQKLLSSRIVDKWDSSARLAELVRITAGTKEKRRLRLQILHARDDVEISWKQGEALFQVAVEAEAEHNPMGAKRAGEMAYTPKALKKGQGCVEIYRRDGAGDGGAREIRLDIAGSGGHNQLVSHAPVSLAMLRAFGI